MRILLRNISVKFHPDQIWNDWALGFFEEVLPNSNKKNKMNSNMELVLTGERRQAALSLYVLYRLTS